MSCAIGCMRCVLVIFNIIFVVIGAAMVAIGIILKFFLDQFLSGSLSIPGAPVDLTSISDLPPPMDSLLDTLSGVVGIIFLAVGGTMLLVGICGCCGACCKNKCCLILYIVFVTILLGGQVAAMVYFFVKRGDFEKQVKTELQKQIDESYAGDNGTDSVSLAWTLTNKAYECCGISNYSDFYTAANWNRTYTYSGVSVVLTSPLSCCKFEGGFLSAAFSSPTCGSSPNSTTSNYQTGCFDKFMDLIDSSQTTVIIVCVVAAVVQILLIIFACCVCKEAGKKDDDDDPKH